MSKEAVIDWGACLVKQIGHCSVDGWWCGNLAIAKLGGNHVKGRSVPLGDYTHGSPIPPSIFISSSFGNATKWSLIIWVIKDPHVDYE